MPESQLTFIKLGGSLITDKDQANSARPEAIRGLLHQVKLYLDANPDQKVLLGHGSGSFGHQAARQYATQAGVHSPQEWMGFQQVWYRARQLNQMVIDQAFALGLPVMAFAPSAAVSTRSHEITTWNLQPIRSALAHGLIPLVYGDVVTDSELGGTILSTEELFAHLALEFKPERLLFAGLEAGVFADYPANTQLISHISPDQPLTEQVGASGSIDVTGGMRSKVALLQRICQTVPGARAVIFSGVSAPNLGRALSGEDLGTSIY